MITEMPFMRAFMPPTPAGGTIPTVAPRSGGISPDDLLALPPLTTPRRPHRADRHASRCQTRRRSPTAPTPSADANRRPARQPPTHAAAPTELRRPHTPISAATPQTRQRVHAPAQRAHVRLHLRARDLEQLRSRQYHDGAQPLRLARRRRNTPPTILKPNPEDKNVSPVEMVNFVREQTQVSAITRIGGDMELLKHFIAANIPVIVETGYSLEGEVWLGHYQTIVGYDDNQNVFYIYDSWLGTGTGDAGMTEHYSDFDSRWQAFNRTFIVIYEKDRESVVQQILGDRADVTKPTSTRWKSRAQEASANRAERLRLVQHRHGLRQARSVRQSAPPPTIRRFRLQTLPFRMLWYQFGPFEAYFQTGRYDDVLALVNNNISSAGQYVEETLLLAGQGLSPRRGAQQDAAAAFQRALAQNPNYAGCPRRARHAQS